MRVCLSICLLVCLLFICPSTHLFIYLSAFLSVCLSARLYVYLLICVFVLSLCVLICCIYIFTLSHNTHLEKDMSSISCYIFHSSHISSDLYHTSASYLISNTYHFFLPTQITHHTTHIAHHTQDYLMLQTKEFTGAPNNTGRYLTPRKKSCTENIVFEL